MPLSVVINTKDAESTLKSCLQSVSFADEIVVVDMHSTDNTVNIARQFTDKIFEYKDVGYVEPARDFAIEKASYDWILVVDADERVPNELKKYLASLINSENPDDVYLIPRKNIIFDKWIKGAGWWPDYQPRFFKKGHVIWQRAIHSKPSISGRRTRLPAREELALEHLNYKSVEQFIERLNRYTTVQAQERKSASDSISSAELVDSFQRELVQRLFAQEGLKIGTHGLVLAFLQAFSEMAVAAKIWQQQGFESKDTTNDNAAAVSLLRQHLAYWLADYQVNHSFGLGKIYWMVRRRLKI